MLLEVETDMTLFYRRLAQLPRGARDPFEVLGDVYYTAPTRAQRAVITDWLTLYWACVGRERLDDAERKARMDAINPLYVPRNYVVQRVIDATEAGDRNALPELMDVLRRPYTEQPGKERFAEKRPEWARRKVGCSMLSCSS